MNQLTAGVDEGEGKETSRASEQADQQTTAMSQKPVEEKKRCGWGGVEGRDSGTATATAVLAIEWAAIRSEAGPGGSRA